MINPNYRDLTAFKAIVTPGKRPYYENNQSWRGTNLDYHSARLNNGWILSSEVIVYIFFITISFNSILRLRMIGRFVPFRRGSSSRRNCGNWNKWWLSRRFSMIVFLVCGSLWGGRWMLCLVAMLNHDFLRSTCSLVGVYYSNYTSAIGFEGNGLV